MEAASLERPQPQDFPTDPEGRRRNPRACLLLPAAMEALSGIRHVKLVDVSMSGARVEGPGLPAPGKEAVLKCGDIEVFGTIVWSAGGRCGIEFDEFIGLRDVVTLRMLGKRYALDPEERRAAEEWVNGIGR